MKQMFPFIIFMFTFGLCFGVIICGFLIDVFQFDPRKIALVTVSILIIFVFLLLALT